MVVNVKYTLVHGFTFGFHLGFKGMEKNLTSKNLKSALQCPDVISEKLRLEIKAGRVAGPFTSPLFKSSGQTHWVLSQKILVLAVG